ncbi:MAG: hypothetical protein D6766_10225 [Verrucomicrobia bacterium]|nr:MAG: hypothetical protein D6766_10225 [Verrucomicrobiota bacterium]
MACLARPVYGVTPTAPPTPAPTPTPAVPPVIPPTPPMPPTPPPKAPPWLKVTTLCRSMIWICACRPLTVVTLGAAMMSTPPRCSSARMTTRNCGSVRMPVIVPTAGMAVPPTSVVRKPAVRF